MNNLAQHLRDAADMPHLQHRQLMLDSADRLAELETKEAQLDGYLTKCDEARVSVIAQRDKLDAELQMAYEQANEFVAAGEPCRHDAFELPTCPTCGGTRLIDCASCDGTAMIHPSVECGSCNGEGYFACPDCVDGKVSHERMAKVFAAVERLWAEGNSTAGLTYLRGIR